MFGGNLNSLSLKHLTYVEKRGKVLGLFVITAQVFQQARVAGSAALVFFHHRGGNVVVGWQSKLLH